MWDQPLSCKKDTSCWKEFDLWQSSWDTPSNWSNWQGNEANTCRTLQSSFINHMERVSNLQHPHSPHCPTTCHRCLGEHDLVLWAFAMCSTFLHLWHSAQFVVKRNCPNSQGNRLCWCHTGDWWQSTSVDNSSCLLCPAVVKNPILVAVTLDQTPVQTQEPLCIRKHWFDVIANKSHKTFENYLEKPLEPWKLLNLQLLTV